MRLLVISSCTGRKKWKLPGQLHQEDFRSQERLRRREAELQRYMVPAAVMYEGAQHKGVLEALAILKQAGVAADLQIVSAGYGLVAAERHIAPYDVTFENMGKDAIGRLADSLEIPAAVRQAIREYPLVIFLLGAKYLTAIRPPLSTHSGQRLLFFAAMSKSRLGGAGVVRVAAQRCMCGLYGSTNLGLKGAMFRTLAQGIATDPERWLGELHRDETDQTATRLLELGLRGGRVHGHV